MLSHLPITFIIPNEVRLVSPLLMVPVLWIYQEQKTKKKQKYLKLALFFIKTLRICLKYIFILKQKPSLIFINIGIKFHKYDPLKMPSALQSKYSSILLINAQRAKLLSLGTHARMIFSFFYTSKHRWMQRFMRKRFPFSMGL